MIEFLRMFRFTEDNTVNRSFTKIYKNTITAGLNFSSLIPVRKYFSN